MNLYFNLYLIVNCVNHMWISRSHGDISRLLMYIDENRQDRHPDKHAILDLIEIDTSLVVIHFGW